MIETISKLLNQIGANKVAMTIQTDDANNVTIVMNTFMPPGIDKKNVSEDVIKLRHALSAPLIIHGNIGEVDVNFTEQLTQYVYGYEKGAQLLRSSSDLVSTIETASANVTASVSSATTKGKKADTTTQNATQSAPTSKVPVATPNQQPQQTSAFHIDDDEQGL